MRVIKEGPITQLTYLPKLFPVNCYLVEEKDGLTLIDAGLSLNSKAIMNAAKAIGKPITSIVLTHAHADHVGSLDILKKQMPDVKVLISARDAKLLRGDTTLEQGEVNKPIRGSIPRKIATVPDVLLQEGDRIGSLSAIAAPGHTPGSMAFLDARNGCLLTGDAFQTFGGIAVSGIIRPSFPFPAIATWSLEESLATALKLYDLKPALLAAGHGNMERNPAHVMLRAIQQAERVLNKRKGR
ncbi:MBL fold metallo-hydrolase [Paenibacillus sp. CAU 1782]